MTRAAFRDLSNTPQRVNIRQHAAHKPGSGAVVPQQKSAHAAAGRWCSVLANPSPAFGSNVGSVQLQPSAGSSKELGDTRSLNAQPQERSSSSSAKDPLALLAPAVHAGTSASHGPYNLQQQLQQHNEALVRDFRRASGLAAANLRPPSPVESLNATQSALESCIRELDGIMPNFSALERSATATPPPRTTLSYSPSHLASAQASLAAEHLSSPGAALAQEASTISPSGNPQHESNAASAGEAGLALQPTLARKSAGTTASPPPGEPGAGQRASTESHRGSIDSQRDTDKAVATLGDAMLRLQKELSMLGQELRNPPPSGSH